MTTKKQGGKPPKSAAERQAELKKRRADAGLVRIELYATPENARKIRRYADAITRKKKSVK